jgi:CubicO group peptidase (beta-lactamase class C family)
MRKRFVLFFTILLLILTSNLALAQSTPNFNPQTLDDYLKNQVKINNLPGLAVAVVKDNKVVFLKGYGEATPGQPITGQTQFYIGSLTKTLTSLAVMQLVEQGKIELNSPIQRYLPWFTLADPNAASKITIRHLLNQTSGLGEGSDPGVSDFNYAENINEQVRGMADANLLSVPGEKFQYYNGNYQVLGLVIEQISGQPYGEYMREHVFTPLGMNHTITNPKIASYLAQGNSMVFGWPFPNNQIFRPGGLPSGYVISTAEDLAHLMIAELNQGSYGTEQIVSSSTLALTHTPPNKTGSSYGMGWVASKDSQFGRVLYHDGALENFNAQMILFPDMHTGFVALTNQGGLVRQYTFNQIVTSGMADILGGNQPKTISYAWIGWVLLGIVLLDLLGHLIGFLRLPHWSRKMATQSLRKKWMNALLALLIPLILLSGILLFVGGTSGSLAIFTLVPDLATWIIIGLALAITHGAVKVICIVREQKKS